MQHTPQRRRRAALALGAALIAGAVALPGTAEAVGQLALSQHGGAQRHQGDQTRSIQQEIKRAGVYSELWQSFAVLLAIRTVGVMGDERTYAYPVIVRAVVSDDAMTADWARLPHDLLEALSSRIIAEVPGVNRVALDITSKPPGTIEWE